MSFSFASPRVRRRPSLTPMIDVVFLLLVFFMLAARFGVETEIALSPASPGAATADWQGPPRLVQIAADGIRLNGVPAALPDLSDMLEPLVQSRDDPVILMPDDEVTLQRLLDVMAQLRAAGFSSLILAEAP
ncbi:Biopolymer transport protein ExbD/TolR [Roseibacterium elongatum DSM 19469]|uniref:Biopolymer transport protein ExbD/TolR n=1 Tax=Roseicyclus elongatus DSM 19469 TaxID=1294273 RepID=W8RZY8_9RHOB|nr:biopolymer transporter ExbD [Roseibacterium elongatum]AHM03407.1 Biopolymer transport protein ExbD/TolR [Roseibacterium elongatum DSM 19469]